MKGKDVLLANKKHMEHLAKELKIIDKKQKDKSDSVAKQVLKLIKQNVKGVHKCKKQMKKLDV